LGTLAILALENVYAGALASALDLVAMANDRALARLRENDPGARARPPWKAFVVSGSGAEVRSASGALVPVDMGISEATRRFDGIFIPPFACAPGTALARRVACLERERLWLQEQYTRGAMLAANYTAVFVLAEAGVLREQAATVPFTLERQFRQRYPILKLDLTRSLLDAGNVLCGAALSASYPLCWRLIERRTSAAIAQRLFHDVFFDTGGDSGALAPVDARHGDQLVERAQTWLAHHLATEVNMTELARYAAVSPRTLLRRFQAALELSPHKYLRNLRMDTARRGLEVTRFQVEKIARGVGYADVTFFSQLFRQHTGMTPAQYRRHARRSRSQAG